MRLRNLSGMLRKAGYVPLLLSLLLVIRVAASPAIQCQHELAALAMQEAKAAASSHHSHSNSGHPATDEAPHKGHFLTSPCPFFGAPGVLPDCGAPAVATALSVSRIYVSLSNLSFEGDDVQAAYNPRAPPLTG
jgi:hypothetical protein